ncbi:acetylornithine transaminase [Corynebacterium bovis]|uniref:Acetylornithine aminotransferase n=1 Tax=Corynebacterium bovis DSM 20582 = CIP 54.80 TaxID=927655 RepID=A0A8H9YAL6_9CORY|nr:acetylornithine transaminase [Corynebacterium bovis]MBB3115134.1 acetylornithine aminotransferase [Corynebacterium bovis DSM 20582 = CIP 54.80]QQC47898.1 acetylornithine transaminase [Corynebacterium bovis]RRO80185.1 acetylornithine transaminase [Corynebacterium bovis]RRO80642.1 acetylornithine transaminase [Corynebacterium bovis]RRO84185.1 acetylornithine transaminase [Corynebacterium bovis]
MTTDPTTGTWRDRWAGALMDTYGTPAVELVSGRGARVTDSDGREYIDLLAGIAVNALGHAHPAVVDAVSRQVATLGQVSNVFAHPQVISLAERIKEIVGEDDARVFFCNSGAEANEAAFKLARLTGRPRIIAAENGFHGRTMGSLALTGQPAKRAPFEPLPAGVEFVPYGDIDALRALADDSTAAVILESIQGETGVVPPPPGYLARVRELCDTHGILMIVDEVQAGMGRTGRWFGYQEDGIVPDVVTMAKGLGGGLPLGACVAMPRADLFTPGGHGTTFGGNPVSCAAGLAVVDTIRREGLLDHARRMGDLFREGLEGHDAVREVRGRGLMLGVVLREPAAPGSLDPLSRGLILNQPAPDVLRIVPPLTITDQDVRTSVRIIREMLS